MWELRHLPDEDILSQWAAHVRRHYCSDKQLDLLRGPRSRKDYLEQIKFPSQASSLGPPVRAGDFGEILVADLLEWLWGYWVPRVRWASKVVRDESPKGSDVVGFYFKEGVQAPSPKDELYVAEAKTRFSRGGGNRLQDAVDGSAKDGLRIDESLNFIKQKLLDADDIGGLMRVERFQNQLDEPYRRRFGAAALFSEEELDHQQLKRTDTRAIEVNIGGSKLNVPHPNRHDLDLILIRGPQMMKLVHELYRRAADEA